MNVRLIFALTIAAIVILFALQNAAPVAITFIVWRFESPLALLLAITLILGAIASALLAVPARLRRGRELSQRERSHSETEGRLAALGREIEAKDRRIRELEARAQRGADAP